VNAATFVLFPGSLFWSFSRHSGCCISLRLFVHRVFFQIQFVSLRCKTEVTEDRS